MNEISLKKWIESQSEFHHFEIDESISELKIKCESAEFSDSLFTQLFDELKNLPSRDVFNLEIKDGSEIREFSSAKEADLTYLQRIYAETIRFGGIFLVELKINKFCKNGYLSVYFIESLNDYFGKRHSLNIIRELSSYFLEGINFVVYSQVLQFGSRMIFFSQAGASPIYCDHSKRKKIIEKFKDSCSFLGYENFSSGLLPGDFYLEEDSKFKNINNFFDEAFLYLSFAFIANQAEVRLIDENKYALLVKMHGYKAIDFEVSLNVNNRVAFDILYKIYDWIYQGDLGNSVEKIGLVRNLISLHSSESNEIMVNDILWKAIKSNYKVYLKDNVEVYLEAKSKIAEVLTASVERTQQLVEGVISSIRTAIGVLITFLLTVVIVNGFKDIGEALKIFSISYLLIVIIIALCAAYWVSYSIKDAKNRFEDASNNIRSIINSTYKNVLLPAEIREATEMVKLDNLAYLNKYTKEYKEFWYKFLLFFCGLYFIGTLIYLNRYCLLSFIKAAFAYVFGAAGS